MEYIKVSEAAEKWGISPRKRLLCAENRIDGVIKKGKLYMIPINASKPIDARTMKGISISQEFVPLFLKMQLFVLD